MTTNASKDYLAGLRRAVSSEPGTVEKLSASAQAELDALAIHLPNLDKDTKTAVLTYAANMVNDGLMITLFTGKAAEYFLHLAKSLSVAAVQNSDNPL